MTRAILGRSRRPPPVGLLFALALAGLLAASAARTAAAAPDLETLAGQIADSLQQIPDKKYQTIAFSRVRQVAGSALDVDTLIDFTNVKIVRGQRLRVVDRSKLQLILKEQSVQLQDFVSAQKYQELGKLLGVDLFLYGTLYRDALVLKAIDVQNSAIAWADSFPIADGAEAPLLQALSQNTVASLEKDQARLQQSKIRLVSFWGIDTGGLYPAEAVMDQLSVALTQAGLFKVVDRENIQLIVAEQQLNQQAFIDEKNAKRLGELYGVDAFIYGTITRRQDATVLASLKMLSIYNGVIEWADLIKVEEGPAGPGPAGAPPRGPAPPPGMAYVPGGAFVMGSNAEPDAAPAHQVAVNAFFIDVAEVSNLDYQRFVIERKYRAPVGWSGNAAPAGTQELPVVGVSWDDAQQYCRFVGKRLPDETEWEKAARGSNGQMFPWVGQSFSPGFAVTRESGKKHSDPVQSAGRDVSTYGVKHLAGNVREWVFPFFQPYPGGSTSNPKFGRERVVRGGSWATDQHAALAWYRGSSNPNLAWQDIGFRCAKTAGN